LYCDICGYVEPEAEEEFVTVGKPQYIRYCADCECVDDCRDKFGAFWRDRSNGGTGCAHPFDGDQTPNNAQPLQLRKIRISEWIDEYEARLKTELEALSQLSPKELDAMVVKNYGGRFKSKYGAKT
jgi:hypothetical protein